MVPEAGIAAGVVAAFATLGAGMLNKVVFPHQEACQYLIEEIKSLDSLSAAEKALMIEQSSEILATLKARYDAKNVITITEKAIEALGPSAKIHPLFPDWFSRFYDHARHISDEEFQNIWAALLASELQNPGTHPKKLMRVLADLEPYEARLFSEVCDKTVYIRGAVPPNRALIFRDNSDSWPYVGPSAQQNLGILEETGLVSVLPAEEFCLRIPADQTSILVEHGGSRVSVQHAEGHAAFSLPVGDVQFTQLGLLFYDLVPHEPRPGYLDICVEHWKKQGFRVVEPS